MPKKKEQEKTPFSDKIDIRGGKMTFGQRIDLGKLFQSGASEVEKFERAFEILHKKRPNHLQYTVLMKYFYQIIDGLTFWAQQEAAMLHYEPTEEEVRAGIKEYSEKVGELGTVKSLAKTYSTDPDVILSWEYGKVFGLLFADLEEAKFQRRLNKVIEQKYNKK